MANENPRLEVIDRTLARWRDKRADAVTRVEQIDAQIAELEAQRAAIAAPAEPPAEPAPDA